MASEYTVWQKTVGGYQEAALFSTDDRHKLAPSHSKGAKNAHLLLSLPESPNLTISQKVQTRYDSIIK